MRDLFRALFVIIGATLVSVSYQWFFVPHHLVSGGVAGVSLLTAQFLGWPVGLQVFLYNIPILWWAWRDLGRRFLFLTIIGIAALSLVTSLLPAHPVITDDPMLNSIFGGIINGVGIALALRASGSLGGLDIAVVTLNRRYSLPMGDIMMATNGLIVATAGFLGNMKLALYTLIAMFVSAKVVDSITRGAVKKTVMIVTSFASDVSDRINAEMGRGCTMLEGVGTYSKETRYVLFCAVTRYELAQVKEITAAVDPHGFLVVLDTDDVMGRFRSYNLLKHATNPDV